ncbi:MAG: hypothetical protein U0271_43605 [Polyangiaceae bacterium]
MRALAEEALTSSGAVGALVERSRLLRELFTLEQALATAQSPAALEELRLERERVAFADEAARRAASAFAESLPPLSVAMSVVELSTAIRTAPGLGTDTNVTNLFMTRLDALSQYVLRVWVPGLCDRHLLQIFKATEPQGTPPPLSRHDVLGWAPVDCDVLAAHVSLALATPSFQSARALLAREASEYEAARLKREAERKQSGLLTRMIAAFEIDPISRDESELELATHTACVEVLKAFDVYGPAGVALRAQLGAAIYARPIGVNQPTLTSNGTITRRGSGFMRAIFLAAIRGLSDATNAAFDGLVDLLERRIGEASGGPYRGAAAASTDDDNRAPIADESPAEVELNRSMDGLGVRARIELGVARAAVLSVLLRSPKSEVDAEGEPPSLIRRILWTPMSRSDGLARVRWLAGNLRMDIEATLQLVRLAEAPFPIFAVRNGCLRVALAVERASVYEGRGGRMVMNAEDILPAFATLFEAVVRLLGAQGNRWTLAVAIMRCLERPASAPPYGMDYASTVMRLAEALRPTTFADHMRHAALRAQESANADAWARARQSEQGFWDSIGIFKTAEGREVDRLHEMAAAAGSSSRNDFEQAYVLLNQALAREPSLALYCDLCDLRPSTEVLTNTTLFQAYQLVPRVQHWTARALALWGPMPSSDELLERYALRRLTSQSA